MIDNDINEKCKTNDILHLLRRRTWITATKLFQQMLQISGKFLNIETAITTKLIMHIIPSKNKIFKLFANKFG